MAKGDTAVATELDENLLRLLDEKRARTERSRAAEVRMAIRAWVGADDATPARDEAREAAAA